MDWLTLQLDLPAMTTYTVFGNIMHVILISSHVWFAVDSFFPLLFLIFPTTDLKCNYPCNFSACLILTILSSLFLLN